jgi:pyridoxal phosphate enzyme (YggS family)
VSTLAQNVAEVQDRIAAAARQAGRDPGAITLVAVSKTHPPEVVAAAAEVGLRLFGENRLEEALPKMQALAGRPGLAWHMVGHIQSRKARDVAHAGFALVHSVDSRKLAQRLARAASEAGQRLEVLLECNVSGEPTKAGFSAADPARWPALLPELEQIAGLAGLRVRGLMTMAPIVDQPQAARPYFARLRGLRDFAAQHVPGAEWATLSMGMTDDFEAAIAEGATLVRIGRAIFGERG